MTGHWSIGARLTFWYSLILLAGLSVFGVGIWLAISHSLRASLDETLSAQSSGVVAVLGNEFNPAKPEHIEEEITEY
ncbi:MAG TPA: hypothetical protein VKT81_04485, partial [Bryobacteraceae bacterium]|nr:hypothetical protein [Bryobacteraceae bacterium]